jgi:hypothetical protein
MEDAAMVDISDLGDGGEKGRPFPKFDKSRLVEASEGFSPLDKATTVARGSSPMGEAIEGLSAVDKVMKEALCNSQMREAVAELSTVDKAMKEALENTRAGEIIEQMTLGGRALRGADTLSEQIRSMASPLGEDVAARLAELDTASHVLRNARFNMGIDQELLARLESQPDMRKYLEAPLLPEAHISDYPTFPELPPNPIFETNALLEKLSSDFEDMKAVTAATADVQEKQAALVAQLLAASVEGSKAQEKAAAETLRVARISMWISLVAVMLTSAGVGAQALLG